MKKMVDGNLEDLTPDEQAEYDARQEAEGSTVAVKNRLLEALAEHRYAVETGGITLNGMMIQTDRESRANLIAARIIAKEDAQYATAWKTPSGFVTLGAAQIIAVADSVAAFVKKCFAAEAEVAASAGEFSSPGDVIAAFDAAMVALSQ